MDIQNSKHGRHVIQVCDDVPSTARESSGNKACAGTTCGFFDAKTSSKDAQDRSSSMRKLLIALALCIIFLGIEVAGGIKANSLAILTDAAHLLSDVVAFAISLFSLWAAGWEATSRQSYGFLRIEILGALVSVLMIWSLVVVFVYEAIVRLIHDTGEIKGFLMFLVSTVGLLVNIIMAIFLGHDHGQGDHGHHGHREPLLNSSHEGLTKLNGEQKKQQLNINVQGAYLHVLGDSIQSVGVMIGGAIIWYKPEWKIIDLICTLIFSVMVLGTTIKMLRNILEVLMESTPREIDAMRLERGICEMEEVIAVHELHIWAITVGKILLACHVKIRPRADADMVLDKVIDYIKTEHNINHVTIQIERE